MTMKSFLIAICCLFSATAFSQNPGITVQIDLINAPVESVQGNIAIVGQNSAVEYAVLINNGTFSGFYEEPELGWNYAIVSINDCNGGGLFATFNQSDSTFFYGVVFNYCESDSVFGCTDPEALNYQPEANVDNGSCLYEAADNDLCANAIPLDTGYTLINNTIAPQNEGIIGECWNFGSGEGEQSSLWFTFTTPAEPAQISIEAISDGTNTLTDTQFGLFTECGGEMIYCDGNSGNGLLSAFNFSCGELDTNTAYILIVDGWNGDVGTCFLNFEMTEGCGNDIFGCTDPEAINYNPAATIDDGSCEYAECENNEVIVLINTENWGYEISWNIRNENGEEVAGSGNYPNYSTITQLTCLEDGCYTFELFDSFGDGWNDGTFELILDGITLASGTLEDGEFGSVSFGVNAEGCEEEVLGCTDPEALNYNPDATEDDGSCEYFECENNEVMIVIFTENWGYEISWNIRNEEGDEVAGSGDYPSYSTITELTCLEDGCYTFELFDSFGDGWNGGSFQVILNNNILASGTLETGDFGSVAFGVNAEGCEDEEVFGCTDPLAINFSPEATIDDGSCQYACTQAYLGFDFLDGAPDDSSYIFMNWVILNQFGEQVVSGNFYNWAPQFNFCLEDGCYTFAIYNVSPDWNGIYNIMMFNEVLASGEFSGSEESFQFNFGVNEEGCGDPQEVLGCTDPEAINYNPNATIDDGSCSYEFECGISFDVIADSTGENTFYIIPSDNIINASSVLWDFGDGGTSNEYYPTHIYEDDGPYVLCLYVTFGDSLGNFCQISYCEVLDGSLFGGSGVLSGGFNINVIQPGTLSDNVGLAGKEIAVYPNPTNDITTISYLSDRSEKLTLRVTDLTGKLLEQRVLSSSIGQQKIQVDLSEFPQGLYLIGLEQDGSRSYAKVVRR